MSINMSMCGDITSIFWVRIPMRKVVVVGWAGSDDGDEKGGQAEGLSSVDFCITALWPCKQCSCHRKYLDRVVNPVKEGSFRPLFKFGLSIHNGLSYTPIFIQNHETANLSSKQPTQEPR